MTIERHAGRQQLVCDCGFAQPKTYERDEFDAMLLDAREAGWTVGKIAGAWTHACPACVETARPKRQGRLI